MSTNNTVGLQGVSTESVDALDKSNGAFKVGYGLEQVIDYYDKWAPEGTYEKVCISNIAIQY